MNIIWTSGRVYSVILQLAAHWVNERSSILNIYFSHIILIISLGKHCILTKLLTDVIVNWNCALAVVFGIAVNVEKLDMYMFPYDYLG